MTARPRRPGDRLRPLAAVAVALIALHSGAGATDGRARFAPLAPVATAFRDRGVPAIRGVTVGPIESTLHPGRGYGTPAYERTLDEIRRMGGTWVSLTPFGRAWDLRTTGVDPTFEAPHAENRAAVRRAVRQAHERGLRVLLVPHLWVESGEWRALVDPGDDTSWRAWARGYGAFVTGWARLAEEASVDIFSVGVELRSFATTPRAPLLLDVIREVRRVYRGPLTYGGNWDDVEDTAILGAIDVIGVNAFYPLAEAPGSRFEQLLEGGRRVAERGRALATDWGKPVLFTEIGYTTRPDPGVEPWTWPDGMTGVRVDPAAQAEATLALLAPLLDEPWFAGFFVWRVYADPDDMSQEPEWGFSPRGKPAELVLRDAFSTRWGVERRPGGRDYFSGGHAELPGIY